jgi:hypothetical protein
MTAADSRRPLETTWARRRFVAVFFAIAAGTWAEAVETGIFRLLSVTESLKLILISHPNTKTKYLLDVSAAKITLDGKPAEFLTLRQYSTIQVFFEPKKGAKDGVDIDGVASEIRLTAKVQSK